ncbi:hypothetical protein [Sorangium sp. So ce131]|uniref:hypothetical protein n=1 Tax=Sorangium sp. So ce131 TaxID=3133282 RepID=UPI003F60C791
MEHLTPSALSNQPVEVPCAARIAAEDEPVVLGRAAGLGRARFALAREAFAARAARILGGWVLVLHGLAHAVLPMRGAGALEASGLLRGLIHVAWSVALVGFVGAGLGLLGASPFRRRWRELALAAAAASVFALIAFQRPDLAPGLFLDAAIVLLVPPGVVDGASPVGAGSRLRRAARRARDAVACGFVLFLAVAAASRPWHRRWGATDAELRAPLPGDQPGRDPAYEANHAITIHAPPEAVWPWLAQIGQDRAGFYSHDWLENLFLLDIHNADAIHPEWQDRRPGDLVRAAPAGWLAGLAGDAIGWRIAEIQPNRALVLTWWGAFVLSPAPGGATRLVVRTKMGDPSFPVVGSAITFLTLDLEHFIMEHRMLQGIKERAEAHRRTR